MNERKEGGIDNYQMVWVMAVPADGARMLARMPYFFPSMASVFVKPIMAALAAE